MSFVKSKDAKIFLEALAELEKDKGISKESLLTAVEQALLSENCIPSTARRISSILRPSSCG